MATTALTDAQISEALATLTGWERQDDNLARTFTFDHYLGGIGFAAAVGMICETRNHHPELLDVGYKKVVVAFTTHDAGSKITQKDVEVAAAINAMMNE